MTAIFLSIGDWAEFIARLKKCLTMALRLVNIKSTNLQNRFTNWMDMWHVLIICPKSTVYASYYWRLTCAWRICSKSSKHCENLYNIMAIKLYHINGCCNMTEIVEYIISNRHFASEVAHKPVNTRNKMNFFTSESLSSITLPRCFHSSPTRHCFHCPQWLYN